jgi:long-chain acyl-CoA synthetase
MALMTLAAASRLSAASAITDEYGSCTWQQLNARVNRLIRGLQAAGLGRGDRLVMFAGNSRAVFELMLAAHHAGISYVPVNWHFTAEELAHVMIDAQAVALFTDAQFSATAQLALDRVQKRVSAH